MSLSRNLKRAGLALFAGVFLLAAPGVARQEPAGGVPASPDTGWVCGLVVDEVLSFVAEAEVTLAPEPEPGAPEAEPVAHKTADAHGAFCVENLPAGFYRLRVQKPPWPMQPPRTVEVRAGLVNHVTPPIELELEPGEPRVAFPNSFDGMPVGPARGVVERLLKQGDAASLQELARRLLPKRGVRIDVDPLIKGLDPKPLLEELVRQLESGYLPPLKTARYVFLVGQLSDARTRDPVVRLLLRKLRDSRPLPSSPYAPPAEGSTAYVSDEAIQALARLTGKDFNWKYGKPPVQNTRAIDAANTWWRQEVERKDSRRER